MPALGNLLAQAAKPAPAATGGADAAEALAGFLA